jgi:hypothetical protein
MFTLYRMLPLRRLLGEQMPALLLAWLLAETFYKFHSFTLECAAFLATWFVLDAALQAAKRLIARGAGLAADPPAR